MTMMKRLTVCVLGLCLMAGTSYAEMLQIKGSDTLINLVQRLSEVYMQKNPGKMIAVTGGGSGTGIAAMINGKCDIANASRGMKSKEVADANSRGINPTRIVVSPRMNRMNGNAQIVAAVKSDPSGIGYVGVGYVKEATGIMVVRVARNAGAPYASPLNSSDVNSGAYPIARPLNQYVNGTPSGDIRDFIAFELSPEGQKIVEEQGFFPLPAEYTEYNKKAGL